MVSATERRQMILEVLSVRREDTCENLAEEFGVNERTIRRDIEILTCFAPIFTSTGRYGGGISVADGWYVGRRYLHKDQEALLLQLMNGLQPEHQKTMQSILDSFAMPKVKER